MAILFIFYKVFLSHANLQKYPITLLQKDLLPWVDALDCLY